MNMPLAQVRSLPLQGGGLGWGAHFRSHAPHPDRTCDPTSPFQGEVKKAGGESA